MTDGKTSPFCQNSCEPLKLVVTKVATVQSVFETDSESNQHLGL